MMVEISINSYSMELNHKIYDSAEYVRKLFLQHWTKELVYHKIQHTQTTVNRAVEIAGHYSLNEVQLFIVTISAWFHDTGHLFGSTELHEEKSASIMREYFKNKEVDQTINNSIESCILSTKLPQSPKNLMEEIICDADLYHLGTEEFPKNDELVKKELELRNKISIDSKEWIKHTLYFLLNHKYFTAYCQQHLNEGKANNIELLHKLLS